LYPKVTNLLYALPVTAPARRGLLVTKLTASATTRSDDSVNRSFHIYRRLRELIVRGRLAPGSRVIESEVATRLEASRTPVRSALQRLRQEGYITAATTGRQLRLSVAPLTREDAREVFGIVAEVEGLGARWAAELPEEERSELVREMTELNRRLVQCAGEGAADPEEVFDLHTRFHGRYMDGASAPRLAALHRAIKPQAERYRRIYSSRFAHESQVSADEHEGIIRSIAAGDPDAAQRAVQLNWRNAADRLSQVIDLLGERGSW
jgi:DNA-binding GntR family transcriptional regulator